MKNELKELMTLTLDLLKDTFTLQRKLALHNNDDKLVKIIDNFTEYAILLQENFDDIDVSLSDIICLNNVLQYISKQL